MNHPKHFALSVALVSLFSACQSNAPAEEKRPPASEWLQPSPLLAEQIESEARRLPWTRGVELMEQIRWFALVGEPAYEKLLELAADSRDHVASAALAALGATSDSRLVPYLHELNWSTRTEGSDVHLERARALVRLGDWSAIPTLIEGLADSRVYTRSLCHEVLRESTGENMGFDPKGDPGEREKAVMRWERWWLARAGEGLLSEGK